MSLNPFASVSDYPGMLKKIAVCLFVASLVLTVLLRSKVTALDNALAPYTFLIPILGFNLPLGTVFPAFAVTLASHILQLHDHISNVLGIRHRFDILAILFPLAIGSGASLDSHAVPKIRANRKRLMNDTFYPYASSSPNEAVIGSHYITMALDQWCWYWIVLDVSFITIIAAGILFFAKSFAWSSILLLLVISSFALLQFVRKHCEKYAFQQVELILADPKRKSSIRETFDAL